ncbi:MAG: hypothetical protein ACI867_000532 [Glaciecola sp.]|jgi:hypothetical protein
MRHLRSSTRLVAGVAALSLTLAACASDGEDTTSTDNASTPDDATSAGETMGDMDGDVTAEEAGDPYALFKAAVQDVGPSGTAGALAGGLDAALNLDGDVNSAASQVRASLTTLLQEHVYLAGAAVDAAFSFGLDSGEFGLAAGALDTNSVEISQLIGSVAPDQEAAFLGLWREHIGFFVDYAVGAATDDQPAKDAALASLDGYRAQAGSFFETITNGELPADAIAENLKGHISTLAAAIDAAAAGDPQVWSLLQKAADHVAGSAAVISKGVVAAAGLEGDTESAASATLTTLSQILEEHVFLAGFAVRAAYGAGGDLEDPSFVAAAGVLDENSVELAAVIATIDADSEAPFLALWREHIGFFVNYAVGIATGDDALADGALASLAGYGDQAGAFFEGLSGGVIPASAVKGALEQHVISLSATIRAFKVAILG